MKNFQPIAGFEDRYCIYLTGDVKNLANNAFLKPSKNPNGYLKVSLASGNGTHKQMLIHRLVALHFIPNPYLEKGVVNHKDGNKERCHASNLEWVTFQQNAQHALKTGLRPGYMSADDKEAYLQRVLAGEQVKDIAFHISRRPETLHKMLRTTADRLKIRDQWDAQMKENRANAACKNLKKINA